MSQHGHIWTQACRSALLLLETFTKVTQIFQNYVCTSHPIISVTTKQFTLTQCWSRKSLQVRLENFDGVSLWLLPVIIFPLLHDKHTFISMFFCWQEIVRIAYLSTWDLLSYLLQPPAATPNFWQQTFFFFKLWLLQIMSDSLAPVLTSQPVENLFFQ